MIRAAAAELPRIGVAEAAAMLLVILRAEPEQYERAAVRWLGRLCLERTRVDLDDLSRAAAALDALPERPGGGAAAARRGLPPRRAGAGRGGVPRGRAEAGLRGLAQRRELAHPAEPAERARLDLAHALGRDAELAADLAQRRRLAAGDPVAQLDDLALALGQLAERGAQRLGAQRDVDLVLGRRRVGRQQVAERGVLLLAERPVERRDRARGVAQRVQLLDREVGLGGQLGVGRRRGRA